MDLLSRSAGTKSETQAALQGGRRKVGQLSAAQTGIELNRRYIAHYNETGKNHDKSKTGDKAETKF